MNQKNDNFKEEEGIESPSLKKMEDIFENRFTKEINLLSSQQIEFFIKNLSSPRFLGSIHIKKQPNLNHCLLENSFKKNLNLELSKSLKNPLNNPITRFLLLLMILFNLFWIISIFLL